MTKLSSLLRFSHQLLSGLSFIVGAAFAQTTTTVTAHALVSISVSTPEPDAASVPVSYELMRPSSTFGDQWQEARARQCTQPSTSTNFQFGSVRNTTLGTITLRAYLADEQGKKLGKSEDIKVLENAVRPLLLTLANYCNNALPTRLYLVTSSEPDEILKKKGYVASVQKWGELIGGRSVGSAALSWSAYVGNTSVSPA